MYIVDNRPFIKIDIRDTTGYFIVDTGGRMGFDKNFALAAGISLTDSMSISGAGNGRQTAWFTTFQKITLSGTGVSLTAERPLVADLSGIRDSLHLPYLDGVIGQELFEAFLVTLDYAGREMRLDHYDRKTTGNGFTRHPFTLYRNQIPMVDARIDGVAGKFIIDTGDRSDLTIFPDFVSKAGINKKYNLSERRVTGYGIGGPVIARTFVLPGMQFGDEMFRNIPARVPEHTEGSWTDPGIAGSIGSGLLRTKIVTFDYNRNYIYIKEAETLEIRQFVYYSNDPGRTAHWYASNFPFRLSKNPDGSVSATYQQATILFRKAEVVETTDFKNDHAGKVPNGTFKFGFDVPGLDSLYAMLQSENQVDLMGGLMNFYGSRMCLVRDPEGNLFQLFEPHGTVEWKSTFLALITQDNDEYDEWVSQLTEKGFVLQSDFSQPERQVRQQNYEQGDLKIELLLLDQRATRSNIRNSGVGFRDILSQF